MTEHTPLPWKCVENGLAGYGDNGRNFEIQSPKGLPIAEHVLMHRLIDDGKTARYNRAKADVEFIVRAVNCHDDLLAALERAARLCNEALPKFDWGKSALDANAIRLLNEVPGEIGAAIAKARGE